jgi:SAM-dependent methyltransferase
VAFEELKARTAEVWSSAPWERIAPLLSHLHQRLVAELAPGPGERFLDVATGTGAVAFLAAREGAEATGVDLAPGLIETARRLAAGEGLDIEFDVGDAESLPYEDASFDVVASAVGAIFAPDHAAMGRELARVCRPGGRLGLAAWRPETAFFPITRRYRPPPEPGQGDSDDWGREDYVRERLGTAFELRFVEGENRFAGDSAEELWDLMATSAGPCKATLAQIEPEQAEELHRDFVELVERHPDDGGVSLPGHYVLILGTRR